MLIMTNSATERVEVENSRPIPTTLNMIATASTNNNYTTKGMANPTTTNPYSPSSSAVMSPILSPILSATSTSGHTTSRPAEPQSVLSRRQFPAVVFILNYVSSPDSLPSVQGVFMSLTNANQECRRLRSLDLPALGGEETIAAQEARIKEERKRDMSRALESWKNAEGVECWVEVHEVVPRKWMDRGSVSSVTHPPAPKLYQNEEEDDEIVEVDEECVGFH